jgi:hypothetical protein
MDKKNIQKTLISDLTTQDDVIQKIEFSIKSWFNYFQDNIENYNDDVNFALGNQWEARDIGEYELRQKIYLTFNCLYSYILNIVGEQQKNSPQIKVIAKNATSDQAGINLYEGILRGIAYNSDSDVAFQTAFRNALMGGYGAWRIGRDYENDLSFNKVLSIIAIPDTQKCYFDPRATKPGKLDGEFCGIYTKMSWEEFFEKYGNKYGDIEQIKSIQNPLNQQNLDFQWFDKDSITICEHFHKIYKSSKLYKLSNGESVPEDKLKERLKELTDSKKELDLRLFTLYSQAIQNGSQMPPPPESEEIKVVDERYTQKCEIKHYLVIKGHILEETTFPGTNLPIIFLDGDSTFVGGRQRTKSFIRFAKDAQRLMNFCMSEKAEWLKTRHKGQFLVTAQMISNYKEQWRNPEKSQVFMMYDPDVRVPGQKPDFLPPPEFPASLNNATSELMVMIENILGRYTANQGADGNDTSGRMVANRALQGNNSVFTYLNNLNICIDKTNKILLDLIPETYFEENRIIEGYDKEKNRMVEQLNNSRIEQLKQMSVDVEVSIGASFELQKLDAYNQLIAMASLNPQVFPIIADLIAANTNLDNTPQIVDRFKNFVVPPNVIATEKGDPVQQMPPPPPSPEVQASQAKAQAEIHKADIGLQEAEMNLKAKMMDIINSHNNNKLRLENEVLKHQSNIHNSMINMLRGNQSLLNNK